MNPADHYLAALAVAAVVAFLATAWVCISYEARCERAREERKRRASLSYEVIAVPAELEQAFMKLNATRAVRWAAFLETALENPEWAHWHERLLSDQRRYAALYADPGVVLMVKVESLPCHPA